jgi:chloramphenicol-sensitive protein RarD
VTAAICLGYPAYFVLRRRYGLDNPAAFGVEVAVIAPVAILLMRFGGPFPDGATERFALIGVGIAGATAMFAYLAAAQRLPLPVFGVLGYLEPVLLVVVALLLGERLHGSDLLTYGLLAVALGLLAVEGFRNARSPVGVRDDPAVRAGTRPRPSAADADVHRALGIRRTRSRTRPHPFAHSGPGSSPRGCAERAGSV